MRHHFLIECLWRGGTWEGWKYFYFSSFPHPPIKNLPWEVTCGKWPRVSGVSVVGLTSGLGGEAGGWRWQRGIAAGPDSPPARRPLAAVPLLKQAIPSASPSSPPCRQALRGNPRVFSAGREDHVPLPFCASREVPD